jgi:hypothetical protein
VPRAVFGNIPFSFTPGVDEARAGIKKRDAAAKSRIDQRVNRGMSERSANLSAIQAARRHKLDGRAQELSTMHGAERMSLHAAHKAESGKPFARAAGAIFALFDQGAWPAVSHCALAAQSQAQSRRMASY